MENVLCIISLLFMFVFPPIVSLIAGSFMSGDISSVSAGIGNIAFIINIFLCMIAWILAIVARVRYKGKFSMVLLIIYGVMLVLGILGAAFFGVAIVAILTGNWPF